jgi:hypothetical protein
MATWSQLYDDVMPEVPGCPVLLAEKEIKNTCIDFMYRTEIQRKTVVNLDHPGGASALSLTHADIVAATDQVIAVLGVWLNDKPLDIKSVEEIEELYPNWMTITGEPVYAVQEGDALWLVPSPSVAQTNTIKLRVSFGPNQTATSFPDVVFHAYREDIALGAKARLLAKPKKPWTDQSLAAEYLRAYTRSVDSATVKASRGGRKVMLTVPTRSF